MTTRRRAGRRRRVRTAGVGGPGHDCARTGSVRAQQSYDESGGESLRLHLVELGLGDRALVEALLRRGDLARPGPAAAAGRDDRAHVVGLLLLHLLLLLDRALRHAVAASDQVGED